MIVFWMKEEIHEKKTLILSEMVVLVLTQRPGRPLRKKGGETSPFGTSG